MYLNIENTANQQIYVYERKQYTIIKNYFPYISADLEDAHKIKLPRQKNTDVDESIVKVKEIEAESRVTIVRGCRWAQMQSSYSVAVKLQLCKLSKFYRSTACQHSYGQQRCGTEKLKTLAFVLNVIITNTGNQNVNPNLHQQFCLQIQKILERKTLKVSLWMYLWISVLRHSRNFPI